MTLSEEYLEAFKDDRDIAMLALAIDLMRSDPADFKLGYSAPNAVIAAAKTFGASTKEVGRLTAVLVEEDEAAIVHRLVFA